MIYPLLDIRLVKQFPGAGDGPADQHFDHFVAVIRRSPDIGDR
jgi:hypothetical protein